MRTDTLRILCIALLASAAGPAFADEPAEGPALVTLEADHAFAPPGFDDNDVAQLVLAGEYPSTCFRFAPATAKVDVEGKRIVVRSQAYFYDRCWCYFVGVPYVQTVELGVLQAGRYEILSEAADGKLKHAGWMPVAKATHAGPDDELYALVQDAKVVPEAAGRPASLTVSGTLTGSCMTLNPMKVLYRTPGVIEVLPTVSLREGPDCGTERRPFETTIALSPPWGGPALVHVRSMNGQSQNRVVELSAAEGRR